MNIAKEKRAIEYLRLFEPKDKPYRLGYSGGKDSDAIRILASLAGVNHIIVHNHTTIDMPETVYYVRSIPGVQIEYPKLSMWKLIVKTKIPPTRWNRYCCTELKERSGAGYLNIFGVRKSESVSRAKNNDVVTVKGMPAMTAKLAEEMDLNYRITEKGGVILNTDDADSREFVERCYRTRSTQINPIVDWTDSDVWEFLHYYGCKGNPLYQEGFDRIGCVGCPMISQKKKEEEFERQPKYKLNYIKAFGRMLKLRTKMEKYSWKTGQDVFDWWIQT